MILTVAGFRKWLEAEPNETIIGQAPPSGLELCPLEKYINAITGKSCLVTDTYYRVGGETYDLTNKLQLFIHRVDSEGVHWVTKEEALEALE